MISIIVIVGQICSGKSTYASQYSNRFKKIDIGDMVREITETQARTYNQALDVAIINKLNWEILHLKAPFQHLVITGVRQISIVKYLQGICNTIGTEFISIVLDVPESILKVRYERRASEKDLQLSFEDAIKRDNLLGLTELFSYLYSINTITIKNYSQYEIDSLQEK